MPTNNLKPEIHATKRTLIEVNTLHFSKNIGMPDINLPHTVIYHNGICHIVRGHGYATAEDHLVKLDTFVSATVEMAGARSSSITHTGTGVAETPSQMVDNSSPNKGSVSAHVVFGGIAPCCGEKTASSCEQKCSSENKNATFSAGDSFNDDDVNSSLHAGDKKQKPTVSDQPVLQDVAENAAAIAKEATIEVGDKEDATVVSDQPVLQDAEENENRNIHGNIAQQSDLLMTANPIGDLAQHQDNAYNSVKDMTIVFPGTMMQTNIKSILRFISRSIMIKPYGPVIAVGENIKKEVLEQTITIPEAFRITQVGIFLSFLTSAVGQVPVIREVL